MMIFWALLRIGGCRLEVGFKYGKIWDILYNIIESMEKNEDYCMPFIYYFSNLPAFSNYPTFSSQASHEESHTEGEGKEKDNGKTLEEILQKNAELEQQLREFSAQNKKLKAQIKPKRKYIKKRPHPEKKIACPGCSAKYSSRMGLYLHLKKVPQHENIKIEV